jgi:hypothetical protein
MIQTLTAFNILQCRYSLDDEQLKTVSYFWNSLIVRQTKLFTITQILVEVINICFKKLTPTKNAISLGSNQAEYF